MSSLKPLTYASAKFFCATLGISRTTWWRWSQMPDFPRAIRIGRSVRWHVEAVEAFLAQQEI